MKRTVTLLALLAALCCFLTVTAGAEAAIVDSGTCGENLTWTLDGEGTLTISGTGEMEDYEWSGGHPWRDSRSEIKAVVIGSGVTTIGSHAFDTCGNLTRVTFTGSSQLTVIGNDAFSDCSSLAGITLPAGVTSIGNNAFEGCGNLTSVIIPEGVTSISNWMFANCHSLASITFPESLTTIGEYAFYYCDSLTSITIPKSVTLIDNSAFFVCINLSRVTLAEGLTTIGEDAFSECSSLTSITIPTTVSSIGRHGFSGCSSLTDVYLTDMDAWCRIDFGNERANPMYFAQNIWLNDSKIISVTVPEGVTELNYTFYGFKDLIRVTLPTSLTSIGSSTFESCTSLILVKVPEGVTNIGKRAFYECTSLANVTLPESLTKIDDEAFYDCRMSAVNISGNVAFIGNSAFADCNNLTAVTLPAGLTEIGNSAFSSCGSLASVDLPKNLTVISNGAFSGCGLTSVKIPDGVTAIGGSAFSWCRQLTDVSIPDSVTTIGAGAFCGCEKLPGIAIPKAVTSIGDRAFWWCSSLKDVYITDLAAWCKIDFGEEYGNPLSQAKNLYLNDVLEEALEIPAGIELIPQYAFMNATCLKRVSIPRSLAGVAANAFEKCTNITEVFYEGSESEWAELPISAGNDPLKNAQVYFNSTLDDYYCRISVQVSGGGRVTVDHTTAKAGDTVTVTAAPYQGYELSAVCVDGVEIEGNTFTVTKNHVVSAVFTRVPVVGGTEDFRLEGLSVRTAAGETLQELPAESLLVTVAVRHLNESGSGTILLAQYDSQGRYRGLMWLTLDEMPQGMALRVTLPVDNSSGEIANLKVFVVEDLTSPLPVGTPVSFGQV